MKAVVIGGGLAGLTAAIELAEGGAQVTVLEAKPRLGGATCSFSRDGLTIDTGQHVFLRCCTAYQDLLAKLGMTAHAPLQPRFDVTVLAPGSNRTARLRRSALPSPLHMLPALLRYPFLNLNERSVVSRASLAMRRVDPADPAVDAQRFGDWLAAHGQSENARRALWDLFAVSALNINGDDASLALAAIVVKTGLLGAKDAADIGVPALPLGELHGDAAARLLSELGAEVMLNTKVAAIVPIPPGTASVPAASVPAASVPAASAPAASVPAASVPAASAPRTPPASSTPLTSSGSERNFSFRIELTRGGSSESIPADPVPADVSPASAAGTNLDISADVVVLAVPPEQAAKLIPADALPRETVAGWSGLGASPIVNIHVIYDRKVMDLPFVAAVNSPVQWIFDRTEISGLASQQRGTLRQPSPPEGYVAPTIPTGDGGRRGERVQYLALSQSAGDEWVDMPVAKLRDIFVPALAELLPAARDANVAEFFVTRERRATFRQVPGTAALRPAPETKLPGLVLAGAWTDTGWPDTMEGAVRSGLAAAAELKRHRATPTQRAESKVTVNADTLGVSP